MSKKIFLITTLLVILLITQFSSIIYAATIDTSRTASLTIIEYENAHGEGMDSSENKPLSGVELTIYKLDDANFNKDAKQLEQDILEGSITLNSQSLTTQNDGKVIFTNLALGRYLVVQTNSPINVNVKMESFLIDLPRTSDDGLSWNYDVTVEPKNVTVYGDVLFTKTTDNNQALQGTTWELQIKKSEDVWEKYDYNETLTTNKDGQISLKNLPAGSYRLVETSAPAQYILDSTNVKEFTISAENTSHTISAINETVNIEKQVKVSNEYVKSVGAYLTDTVKWKVSANVPTIINKMETYSFTDKLPSELDFNSNSFEVHAKIGNTDNTLVLNQDYSLNQTDNPEGKFLHVTFTPSNLSGYDMVYFTYETSYNSSVKYGQAIINGACIEYTNNIDINGNCLSTHTSDYNNAEVHTGSLVILKTDSDNNPLQGAKFKISETKEKANNNEYIKDADGNDLISTSNENGLVVFYGLKYGADGNSAQTAFSNYYITEVESPTYTENGEVKHYNLLADSVEVTVNSTSGEKNSNTPQIINKKGFILPITGATGTITLILIGSILIIVAKKRNNKNDKEQVQ